LAELKGITPKLIRFFTALFADTATAQVTANDAASNASGAVASTGAIQSATVLTLSPNSAFDNERVLVLDQTAFITRDTGPNGQLLVTLIPQPEPVLSVPGPYADDATAAANGVEVGDLYKQPMGLVVWRQA
jgi:hypothetical protein